MYIYLCKYISVRSAAYIAARKIQTRRIFNYLHTRDINRQNFFNVLIVFESTKTTKVFNVWIHKNVKKASKMPWWDYFISWWWRTSDITMYYSFFTSVTWWIAAHTCTESPSLIAHEHLNCYGKDQHSVVVLYIYIFTSIFHEN